MKSAAVLLFAVLAGPLAAQSTSSHPCAAILPPAERLACYDQAFGAPHAAEQDAASVERAKENFGLAAEEKLERIPEPLRLPDIDQIEATITRLDTDARGGRVLYLDNDQIWRITENTSRGPMKVGDVVEIRKGAFGSHNLVTPHGVGLKTKRLR